MSRRVVYEVSLRTDARHAAELDAWLSGHIDDMLALPGFIEAHRLDVEVNDDRFVHTVQYIVADREALDAYLEGDAPRMRQAAIDRFGDAVEASRTVRDVVSSRDAPGARCLNCDALLEGQYCWNCGQRSNTRLISLLELVRDAFGDMFELDSRLWRTLIPLTIRPGYLTAEYLRGRRARYMPPFRMYLVLSFVFFLLSQTVGDGFGVTIDDDSVALTPTEIEEAREAIKANERMPEVAREAALRGLARAEQADASTTSAQVDSEAEPTSGAASEPETESGDDDAFDCSTKLGSTGVAWLDRPFTPDRVERLCREVEFDRGRRLIEQWTGNMPVAALMMLPLMALLLKILYPLSRRYYVEHLLVLVHFHSFLFLFASVGYAVVGVAEFAGVDESSIGTAVSLSFIVLPVYLYKAMRRVYSQGRLATLFKFFVLLLGYLICTAAVLFLTLAYVVVTY